MKTNLLIVFLVLTVFAKGQCYSISTITYSPASYSGTTVSLGDNVFSPMIPIGFSFCFYGAPYDSLTIFSNGVLSFTSAYANTTWNNWGQPAITLPNVFSATSPKNCIMFPWQDLDPSQGGTVTYSLTGTSPNRVFIISFDNVPMDSCTTFFKGQVKLFETTNVVETHISNKDTCAIFGEQAIHGLHSPVVSSTNSATIVSGRNYPSQWTVTNEGTKFTPTCNVCTGLSVGELTPDNFSLYPNPFTAQTILQTDSPFRNATFTVYNSLGQTVKQMYNLAGQTIIFNRDNLSSGLYFFQLRTDSQLIATGKLTIE